MCSEFSAIVTYMKQLVFNFVALIYMNVIIFNEMITNKSPLVSYFSLFIVLFLSSSCSGVKAQLNIFSELNIL